MLRDETRAIDSGWQKREARAPDMHGPLAPPLAAPESSGLRFFRSLSKIRSIAVAGISVVNRPRFEDSVGQLRSPIIRKFALTAPFVRADRG